MLLLITLLVAAGSAAAEDVALDIGHSLAKPGVTAASGRTEYSINRALAMDVNRDLRSAGFSVRLIGADGKADLLSGRTAQAQDATLFVSLHHDSVKTEWLANVSNYSGFSIFVSRKNPASAKSLACARRIGAQLIAAGFKPSRYHALPVGGENRPFADEVAGVHWYDDLIVLKTARQPAVLIESGVVVNPADEKNVTSDEGRSRLVNAISAGISSCFR